MVNNLYQDFASIYDDVMADLFADIWFKTFKKLERKHQLNFRSIVDIGCGTATIAKRLVKPNQLLYLVDQSKAMLKQAKQRCPHGITIQADLRQFQLSKPVEMAISVYGIIHYLTNDQALMQFFKQVKKNLKPNGYFCFDYFTESHIKKYYGGGTEIFEGEHYLSIWHHQWNEKKKQSDIIIEGFQKKGELWKRHQPEWHVQQVFPWSIIKKQLSCAGFKSISYYAMPELTKAYGSDKKRMVLAQS